MWLSEVPRSAGLLSCPDFPWPKGPQVVLTRLESFKQHNNKFTFNFWPYSWRFLVVWERNALVPPFLKTAENSFFKCLKGKTSSLSFPQIPNQRVHTGVNPKKEVRQQATSCLASWWVCSQAPPESQAFVGLLFLGVTELTACLLGGFVPPHLP